MMLELLRRMFRRCDLCRGGGAAVVLLSDGSRVNVCEDCFMGAAALCVAAGVAKQLTGEA